jgi:ABC-2 type transport system permease protein
MKKRTIQIVAKQVWEDTLKNKSSFWLIFFFNVLLFFALISGYYHHNQQQKTVKAYSHDVRERWESNPDKHPHRMAHYGYVVFRQKFPLSFFDFGMDSYVGNVVFLEAHKQNTINFSEASLSNGLLRFGEISVGMILQLLLPLLIFFWGFGLITEERQHGTLRILLTQGVSWQELIIGKSVGLFYLGLTIYLPCFLLAFIFLLLDISTYYNIEIIGRFFILLISYLSYFFILSLLAVYVSSRSKSSKTSLVSLIGFWLFFALVLPKLSQVAGKNLFISPSKIEFDTAIEQELIEQGDSHNPNDIHFKKIKDSLLKAHDVDSTHKLPFNYGGYIMREGERLSAEIYQKHQIKLIQVYQKQQNLIKLTAPLNPLIAIKNISMALSGTDYIAYNDFQNQVEKYRYHLAQTMNELQMKYISNKIKNSSDKNARIGKKHWKEFPDFKAQYLPLRTVITNEIVSFLSLMIWIIGFWVLVKYSSKHLKAF